MQKAMIVAALIVASPAMAQEAKPEPTPASIEQPAAQKPIDVNRVNGLMAALQDQRNEAFNRAAACGGEIIGLKAELEEAKKQLAIASAKKSPERPEAPKK